MANKTVKKPVARRNRKNIEKVKHIFTQVSIIQ